MEVIILFYFNAELICIDIIMGKMFKIFFFSFYIYIYIYKFYQSLKKKKKTTWYSEFSLICILFQSKSLIWAFLVAQLVKNLTANTGDARDMGSISGSGDTLEMETATCCSILTWKIPWTREPGGLQSIGSQRVRHNCLCTNTHKSLILLNCKGHIFWTFFSYISHFFFLH